VLAINADVTLKTPLGCEDAPAIVSRASILGWAVQVKKLIQQCFHLSGYARDVKELYLKNLETRKFVERTDSSTSTGGSSKERDCCSTVAKLS
jgi:hypothetical protein